MKVVVFALIGLSCISLPFAFPAKVVHAGVSITEKWMQARIPSSVTVLLVTQLSQSINS
jgi:hypothetical protein